MKVNIKLIEDGKMPVKAHESDACFDCYARKKEKDVINGQIKYCLGFAIEIPKGYMGLVFPRSSIHKMDLDLSNSVGVIDSGFRGEVSAIFNIRKHPLYKAYQTSDRVCQLLIMPYPEIELNEVEELADSDRGENGYGSTGR